MSLQNGLKHNESEWMKGKGPMGDVVVSSRVRLARNLARNSFPGQAEAKDLEDIREKVAGVVNTLPYTMKRLDLETLPDLERRVLVERNLMSRGHAQEGPGKLLAVDGDEMISIMVNEEDHLRIQVLFPGMQLKDGLRLVNEIDDALEKELQYAFREEWGYLTACPTNVGTGLRASVMVHLPALKIAGRLGQTLQLVSRLGMAVRGMYGEGSESLGNLFQVSNQVTLGVTEDEVIENMTGIIEEVVEQERQARQYLMKEKEVEMRDRVNRAYGLLSYAYRITTEEALTLLSDVKLGIELNLIENVDPGILGQLIVQIRPATLQKLEGKELGSEQRDVKRAELIRNRLHGGDKNVR